MTMKNKLSIRISVISALAMVLAAGAGIGVTYTVHTTIANSYAENSIRIAAMEDGSPLDRSFLAVENLATEVSDIAKLYFPMAADIQGLTNDDAKLADIKRIYSSTAVHTEYVCNYWMVFNPAYTGTTPTDEEGVGFFVVRQKGSAVFEDHKVTNVTAYDETDPEAIAHISWWIQVKKGISTWMKPYYNGNTDQNLVSFIVPVFSADPAPLLLGAAGIDLDFDEIIDALSERKHFADSYPFLINADNTIAWHPDVQVYDENHHYVGVDSTYQENMEAREGIAEHDGVYSYYYKGKRRMSASVPLSNSLSFGISVSTDELYDPFVKATILPVIMYGMFALALSIGLFFLLRYWLKPIQRLTNAVQNVRGGDLDVEIHRTSNDEIGELTDSFDSMVQALRSQRSEMDALAYRDGLTGVKNKNAHKVKIAEINGKIKDGNARFALVMCDVNDLKTINDSKGHSFGDQAIREACLALCHAFLHSPVYRIGGDEFIVVAEGEAYENREALFLRLSQASVTGDPDAYHFAVGMATYQPGVDKEFADVFKRADEAMYLAKKRAKNHK